MWKKVNPYYLQCGNWTITKSYFGDIPKYSLFDNGKRIAGVFGSSEEAIAKYEKLKSVSV
jgi:hypothetical protein